MIDGIEGAGMDLMFSGDIWCTVYQLCIYIYIHIYKYGYIHIYKYGYIHIYTYRDRVVQVDDA